MSDSFTSDKKLNLVFFCSGFVNLELVEDGVAFWTQDDPGRDAEEEPAGPDQGHEGAGPREVEDGAAGEEDHHGHQEDGETGTDGCSQSHGQGIWKLYSLRNLKLFQFV